MMKKLLNNIKKNIKMLGMEGVYVDEGGLCALWVMSAWKIWHCDIFSFSKYKNKWHFNFLNIYDGQISNIS